MSELLHRLATLRLLKPSALLLSLNPGSLAEADLLEICNASLLESGLTVALDVRPDELIGPLTATAGGGARLLKVTEVRERPSEMIVSLGSTECRWSIDGLGTLVDHFNDLFEADRSVKAVAILGERDDALQLWCIEKNVLPELFKESFFGPLNLPKLRALAKKITKITLK
jgi:hypothetical protein